MRPEKPGIQRRLDQNRPPKPGEAPTEDRTHALQHTVRFAVGTRVTSRPPPRSVRAAFPHTAPTSGTDGSRLPYASQHPVSRLSGTEPGTCLVDSHSPWSPPFAPPTPLQIAPLCSSASQLLWQGQTSRVRAARAAGATVRSCLDNSHNSPRSLRCFPAICRLLSRQRATAADSRFCYLSDAQGNGR